MTNQDKKVFKYYKKYIGIKHFDILKLPTGVRNCIHTQCRLITDDKIPLIVLSSRAFEKFISNEPFDSNETIYDIHTESLCTTKCVFLDASWRNLIRGNVRHKEIFVFSVEDEGDYSLQGHIAFHYSKVLSSYVSVIFYYTKQCRISETDVKEIITNECPDFDGTISSKIMSFSYPIYIE